MAQQLPLPQQQQPRAPPLLRVRFSVAAAATGSGGGGTPAATTDVFAARFSPDGALLAAGCNDGAVRVYAAATGALTATLATPAAEPLPVTALRWRPGGGGSSRVLLACGADGVVRHWNAASGKLLHKLAEPGNQVFAADYRRDGNVFATGGKDRVVRVYDEATRALVASLVGGTQDVTPGHSNRIFAIKWHPRDDNVILSAGWDNTVRRRVGGGGARGRRSLLLGARAMLRGMADAAAAAAAARGTSLHAAPRTRARGARSRPVARVPPPTPPPRAPCRRRCKSTTCARGTRCARCTGRMCAATRWTWTARAAPSSRARGVPPSSCRSGTL